MIRTIILDSNIEIINYFKAFSRAVYPGIKIVGALEEASKTKAYELINAKSPRLVIMDIRFFAFLSINIIEEMHSVYPRIKIIVSGDYSDYDYMKKSLDFGVMDFVFKPIKTRELTQCFERVITILETIEADETFEKKILKEYSKNVSHFKNIFLDNLINGIVLDEKEILESISYFNLRLKSPYTIAYVGIDNFEQVLKSTIKDKHILIYKIFHIIEKYFEANKIGFAMVSNFNSICCFISEISELKPIFNAFLELKKEIKNRLGISVTTGIGRTKYEPNQIHISSKEAASALRHKHFIGLDSIIPIDFVEVENDITYKYPIEKEGTLAYSAIFGDYEFSRQLVLQIIDSLGEDLPDRLLSKIVMGIIISISRHASEIGMDIEAKFRSFFDFSKVLNLKTKLEAKTYLNEALEPFCKYMNELKEAQDKETANLAKAHIENNFQFTIDFDELAYQLKTTPPILAEIFLKHTNSSLNDYISSLRVKRAKEIMGSDGNFDDEMLSAMVGYNDSRHFRSIFKRQEGIYPQEYRIELRA